MAQDDGVAIRGIVRPMNQTDLEAELGYTLDDPIYADARDLDLPVIVALEVIPNVEQ